MFSAAASAPGTLRTASRAQSDTDRKDSASTLKGNFDQAGSAKRLA
jgi:hypothetical protein